MKFVYLNNIDDALGDYIKFESSKRSLMGEPPLILTDEMRNMFFKAIDAYENCLIQVFHESNLPAQFLKTPVKFSINEFPWMFSYVYNPYISIDLNINMNGSMETFVNIIKTRYVDGKIIYLAGIPDQYLNAVDYKSVPTVYMVEHKLRTKDKKSHERNFYFQLVNKATTSNMARLLPLHKYIEKEYPGIQKLMATCHSTSIL